MELKLQLTVFILFIQVSLAVWQRVTVIKGQTATLSCPITNGHKNNVEWKNPEGNIMFFDRAKGVNEKRYSINKLSESEFTISISNVILKDGGIYTCYEYGHHTSEKKVEVTVLGLPKMTVVKHGGRIVVKCTAEANHHLPEISWKLNQGPEIISHVQVVREENKYISTDILQLHSLENRVTVQCLVRHPALHSQPLMHFVKIGRDSAKSRSTTTTSSPSAQPQGSTEGKTTTSGWTSGVTGPSSESSLKSSTAYSTNEPKSSSTRTSNNTTSNTTSTAGWTSVSTTTEGITFYNSTEGNTTGSFNDLEKQTATKGNSSLLVFLVSCLIVGLLVVVIFFAIKLRRAHITWKRENDDSNPSEESSKSKSSQEEKNTQGQRRRGILNTAFTQYVSEKPTVGTAVTNTDSVAATESVHEEQTSQPQSPGQTPAIKETEL